MTRRLNRSLLAVILCTNLGLSACCSAPPTKPHTRPTPVQRSPQWLETRIYFGLSSPQGRVTEAQWQAYVDEEITPKFPEGLTVLDAQGQWRNKQSKIVKEASKLLILVHRDTLIAEGLLRKAVSAYVTRFQQESVLRTSTRIERCSLGP